MFLSVIFKMILIKKKNKKKKNCIHDYKMVTEEEQIVKGLALRRGI